MNEWNVKKEFEKLAIAASVFPLLECRGLTALSKVLRAEKSAVEGYKPFIHKYNKILQFHQLLMEIKKIRNIYYKIMRKMFKSREPLFQTNFRRDIQTLDQWLLKLHVDKN